MEPAAFYVTLVLSLLNRTSCHNVLEKNILAPFFDLRISSSGKTKLLAWVLKLLFYYEISKLWEEKRNLFSSKEGI